jgi:hypothetical protein
MRANSLHVVPAQAGTHTLRASNAKGLSHLRKHRASHNHGGYGSPPSRGRQVERVRRDDAQEGFVYPRLPIST